MGDADAYFALRSDPELLRYWDHLPYTRREQAEQHLAKTIAAMESGIAWTLALDINGGEKAIGTVTLHSINTQCRRGEIGYSLATRFQGQGIMREALSSLITYFFEIADFNRIEADIHPDNEPSRRVLLALGFRLEGFLPERWIVGEEVSDSEVYGLLKRYWHRGDRPK